MKKYFYFLILLLSVYNIAISFFVESKTRFLSMDLNPWLYRGIWLGGAVVGVLGILESQKPNKKKSS